MPGIRLGTAAARIKNWERDDIVLIEAAPGTVAAGVFTQNAFAAAPVKVCRAHLAAQHAQSLDLRALVINAGNANAGTGDAGVAAAEATCVRAAQLADCAPAQVLPFSTGVI
ncbi:MAG TPA: bifunctional ornithine acetyltransferase/N-acetylglutamate synthase, partial [Casimicrobiaceae bacterium]|nr:bifunctional ornithine acetyltransferase/N-acetylglutamate synthase [Casimicrobiaceae bacterium]